MRKQRQPTITPDRFERLETDVRQIHDRVYDGLGKELRDEVRQELGTLRWWVLGIVAALILALGGIIVEGRLSARAEYQVIADMRTQLQLHVGQTGAGQ